MIEKAKRLLLTTSLSVNETAFQLGFEYPQYLTRLFKNKTGFDADSISHLGALRRAPTRIDAKCRHKVEGSA